MPGNSSPGCSTVEPVTEPKSISSPAQIAQLNQLRQSISMTEAARFPKIRVSGPELVNMVPEAGVFTARINRDGETVNIVMMMATLKAVADFARQVETTGPYTRFWSEGYLLPSRTGGCVSVLLITAFRLNDRYLTF